jgi:hypothetical protein
MEAASPINSPHVDDPAADAEAFFATESGDDGPVHEDPHQELMRAEHAFQQKTHRGEPISEYLAGAHARFLDTSGEDGPVPDEFWDAAGQQLPEAAYAETGAEAAPQPAGDAGGPDPDPEAQVTDPPPDTRGSLTREYIVFHRVTLTEQTLRRMLAAIDAGLPRVPVGFIEIHRAVTRNDKQAIAEAYAAHKDKVGDDCHLVAVSARAFKPRHVKPEPVPVERRISIS